LRDTLSLWLRDDLLLLRPADEEAVHPDQVWDCARALSNDWGGVGAWANADGVRAAESTATSARGAERRIGIAGSLVIGGGQS
jgi:hypothetical protein